MVFSAANAVEIFVRVVLLSIGTTVIAFFALWCAMRFARLGCAANRYLAWLCLSVLCAALPLVALAGAFAHRHADTTPIVVANLRVAPDPIPQVVTSSYTVESANVQRAQSQQRPTTTVGVSAIAVAGSIWALGSLLLFVRISMRLRAALALKQGTPGDSATPAARNARIVFSDAVGSPVAIGYLHPTIVLPNALQGPAYEAVREHALAHENAHLRRYDDYTALLHQICMAIAWWNPIVWTIASHLAAEREKACDDAVVLETCAAKEYGLSLISLCRGIRFTHADHVLALFEARERLADRIEAIVTTRPRSVHPRIGAACFCAVLTALQFIFATALTPGFAVAASTIDLPPVPQARAHYATAVLRDGRVLIAGGITENHAFTNAAEIYDSRTHTFTAVQPMHQARGDAAAAVLSDGRVLIAGGWTGNGVTHSTEIFDPATSSFQDGPQMRERRAAETATLLRDGRVLVTGGNDGINSRNTCAELYDPQSGRFEYGGVMNEARSQHAAVLLADGRVLISGNGSAEIYDPQTYIFTPAQSAIN